MRGDGDGYSGWFLSWYLHRVETRLEKPFVNE
jgi:hypothetical protein